MSSFTIPERQTQLIQEFESLCDWTDRYRKIIEFGKNLPEMPEAFRTENNKIKGCQSTVWLFSELKEGKVIFHGDSDAMIVKGLLAILIFVYSGQTPQDVLVADQGFLKTLGLDTNLSQTRVNGVAAVLKQIKMYAFAFGKIV